MTLQTEFSFKLPRGYVDADGDLHVDGVMRLATAADEVIPLKDSRVQANPGYLAVILLSRVITKLGDVPQITPKTIEGLFAGDFAFLEDLYRRINETGHNRVSVVCPSCEAKFEMEVSGRAGEP